MKFKEFLFGKKGTAPTVQRDDYGTLNPEQKAGFQQLAPTVYQRAMTGSTPYSGSMVADLTPEEQALQANQSRLNALTYDKLGGLMSGEFPEDYYQNAIYKPLMKQYQEDIQPLIEEQYAGSGSGYWGSARAGAVAKGYRDLQDTLTAERATLAENARNLPATLAPVVSSYSTAANLNAQIPRQVKQLGLDKEYEEWRRTSPDNIEYINAALSFLDLSTVTERTIPGTASKMGLFDAAAEGLIQGAYNFTSNPVGMIKGTGNFGTKVNPSSGGTGNYSDAEIDAILAKPNYLG